MSKPKLPPMKYGNSFYDTGWNFAQHFMVRNKHAPELVSTAIDKERGFNARWRSGHNNCIREFVKLNSGPTDTDILDWMANVHICQFSNTSVKGVHTIDGPFFSVGETLRDAFIKAIKKELNETPAS